MNRIKQLAEILLVVGLACMALMVFGNVVLRYVFSSGITFSEEVSRFLFVWITFLGAVLVFAQGGHIAMGTVVSRLSPLARRWCVAVSGVLMLGCCVLMVWGGWHQTVINLNNFAPVSGVPRGAIYAAAVFAGIGIGVITVRNLVLLMRGASVEQFAQNAETE
ncbi:TRAP transporter small permease [Variovorax sp. HJSM1_2]|uniref:TRAP transporter small permease n=1 Tax=Variovorax sp. HJSM1_2 TaxID=3366263 RepID=UPI003BDF6BFA